MHTRAGIFTSGTFNFLFFYTYNFCHETSFFFIHNTKHLNRGVFCLILPRPPWSRLLSRRRRGVMSSHTRNDHKMWGVTVTVHLRTSYWILTCVRWFDCYSRKQDIILHWMLWRSEPNSVMGNRNSYYLTRQKEWHDVEVNFFFFFFFFGTRASPCCGLSRCGAQAPDAQAQRPWLAGPAAPRHVGSSRTGARTRVPCIGRRTLNHCATREALQRIF